MPALRPAGVDITSGGHTRTAYLPAPRVGWLRRARRGKRAPAPPVRWRVAWTVVGGWLCLGLGLGVGPRPSWCVARPAAALLRCRAAAEPAVRHGWILLHVRRDGGDRRRRRHGTDVTGRGGVDGAALTLALPVCFSFELEVLEISGVSGTPARPIRRDI